MPKARNSKVDEALALYQQGLKLIEIARKLDIPEGTVRRWKCTYKWDSERSQPRRPARQQKQGRTKGQQEGREVRLLLQVFTGGDAGDLRRDPGRRSAGSALGSDPLLLHGHPPGPEDRLRQGRRRQDHREDRGPQRRRVLGREVGSAAGLGQAGQLYEGPGPGDGYASEPDQAVRRDAAQ